MHKMNRKLLYLIVLVCMIDAVSAVGIAHSVADFKDGKLMMNRNQEKSFKFIIQNNDDVSRDVIFKVSTVIPFRVNGGQTFQQTYYMQPKTNQEVTLTFKSPDFNGEFPVKYGYSVLGSSTGTIKLVSETDHVMYVNVGGCSNCLWSGIGIPLDYNAFSLVTYQSNSRHISDLTVSDKNDKTKVEFLEEVDMSGFKEEYLNISFNYVKINTEVYPYLNKRARITFKGLNYSSTPKILRNDQNCSSSVCVVESYSSGTLIFTVSNFSTYTTVSSVANVSSSSVANTSSSSSASSAASSSSTTSLPTGGAPGTDPGTGSPTSPVETPSNTDDQNSVQNVLKNKAAVTLEDDDSVSGSGVVVTDVMKDGARKLISTMAWGVISLILAVFLYGYISNNSVECERILNGVSR